MTPPAPDGGVELHHIQAVVEAAVRAAFKEPNLHCRYNITTDEHQRQHEAIATFLQTMQKIDNVKWNIAKSILTWFAMGLLALLGYGIYHRLFTHGLKFGGG